MGSVSTPDGDYAPLGSPADAVSALPSLPGGTASKVADLYEAAWTVHSLLDLLDGKIHELHLEPQSEDGLGVEFYRVLPSGVREYHSVKRQVPGSAGSWTPRELTYSAAASGRSILGDLFRHLDQDDGSRAVFGSQDSARDMRDLAERARAADGLEGFRHLLSDRLGAAFDTIVERVASPATEVYVRLGRCEFESIGHRTLVSFVEDRIPALIQGAGGTAANVGDVRRLLSEFAWNRLGQVVTPEDVLRELDEHDLAEQPLAASAQVRSIISDRNDAYIHRVQKALINGAQIPRAQASAIAEELTTGSQSLLLAGRAGEGKSCIVAQVLEQLAQAQTPHFALSMDELGGSISSMDLAKRMDLPASPAIVLGQISAGGRAVLCIDQLDALSFVSGQSVSGLQVLEELIQQASRYPNLRIFLACRSFDLEHDASLRSLVSSEPPTARRIDVEQLGVEDVAAALATVNIAASDLSESQIELLRTPLHLFLLLGGGTAHDGFGSRRDLFDRYWDEKLRSVDAATAPGAFVAAAERLSVVLSDRRRLEAPRLTLTGHEAALDAMASEAVVVRDGLRVSFFHATFFDYAFALGFVSRDRALVDWLKETGQDLFRRSQVRQVLEFLREVDPDVYLETLSRLLGDRSVRFHLKRLALDWLGQLNDPNDAEWQMLTGQHEQLRGHVLGSIRNRVQWFDLLERLGVLREWLNSEVEEDRDRAIYLLQAPGVFRLRSAGVASLLRFLQGGSAADKQRLLVVMSLGSVHHSREMMDLFLELIGDGTLDAARGFGMNGDWWLVLYEMSTVRPDYCSEVIGRWVDRQYVLAESGGQGLDEVSRWSQFSENVIKSAASGAPLAFARELLLRVTEGASGVDGGTWGHSIGVTGELVEGLSTALHHLAAEHPDSLDSLLDRLPPDPPLIIDQLKLDAWADNPTRYADQILGLLIRREDLWGRPGIDRAVAEGTRLGAHDLCASLEQLILNHAPKQERSELFGYSRFRLLSNFSRDALSGQGKLQLAQLQRKFPEKPPAEPLVREVLSGEVAPRIPDDATTRMSDENWLQAMRTIKSRRTPGGGSPDWDNETLSRQLEAQTKIEPERFVRLATSRMPDDLSPRHFSAILDGLARAERAEPRVAELLAVIRRADRLPGRPCGMAIGHAVRAIANEDIPPDVIEAIAFYAAEDPDPTGEEPGSIGLVNVGINSVRGVAALAIAALLSANADRIGPLRSAVASLVRDPELAVRCLAALPLLALLREDERESLELFDVLCADADPILTTRYVQQYLNSAVYRSYEAVQPILLYMLESAEAATRTAAARLICLASLYDGPSHEAAAKDAARVEAGDPAMRVGAAAIYARNCGHPDVTQDCVAKLPRFFDDPDPEVRREASHCFGQLQADSSLSQGPLIEAFATSAAFADNASDLLLRLQDMSGALPASICSVAENAVDAWGVAASDISTSRAADASPLSKLIIRFHTQAADDAQRGRALSAIDRMIEVGFVGIGGEVASADRT